MADIPCHLGHMKTVISDQSEPVASDQSSPVASDQSSVVRSKQEPVVGNKPKEIGGPPGPEPTRYGDWQYNGRVTDF